MDDPTPDSRASGLWASVHDAIEGRVPHVDDADRAVLRRLISGTVFSKTEIGHLYCWWQATRSGSENLPSFLVRHGIINDPMVPKHRLVSLFDSAMNFETYLAPDGVDKFRQACGTERDAKAERKEANHRAEKPERVDRDEAVLVIDDDGTGDLGHIFDNEEEDFPESAFIGYFLSTAGDSPVRLFPHRSYTIGGNADNDVIINHPGVSPRHVILEGIKGGFRLRAFGETFVNRARVSECLLKDRDIIRIGPRVFRFLVGSEEEVAEAQEALNESVVRRAEEERPTPGLSDSKIGANSFSGNLEDLHAVDLLQFLGNTRKSGTLRILTGPRDGTLVFDAGNIIYAEWDELRGPDAVYRVMAQKHGMFEFLKSDSLTPGAKRNVASTTVRLVMEGLRRLDETDRDKTKSSAGMGNLTFD